MFRPPEIDRELNMLSRAPAMIRIIERFFVSTKAKSYPFDTVVKKVAESMKSTSSTTESHLNYLLSLDLRSNPDDTTKRWLTKSQFSNQLYLLIDQDYKLGFLHEQVKLRIQQLTSS